MKRIVLLIGVILFAGSVFAQDPGADLKNAGNEAIKAKNFALAFAKYEEYLKVVDYKDNATLYNTAYCANKLKKYAEAEKYFGMSIQNKYKAGSAYVGKAQAEEDQNKVAEMIATLEEGLKAFPGNSKLEAMYATYYLKEGQKLQKANDVAKAAENYEKAASVTGKALKVNAYLSLGSLYFNNGASILQKATPLANTEKEKYEAEKVRAEADFKKASDFLEQGKVLDPTNATVLDLLKQVKAAVK